MKKVLISLVVPAKNEDESIEVLYQEISAVAKNIRNPYEIIFVDDGSIDKTFDVAKKLRLKDRKVKVIKLRGNFGKSIALQIGFENAKGDIIITLDADLQDDPREIPRFLRKLEEGYDLVSGWKKVRHDPLAKVIPSRIFNFATSYFTGVKIHDTNCGFKAYKREVIENLNLYGELYRFIPIFAAKQGFKVGEIVVPHRAREYGKTKFGWERNIKGLLDLITIVFLTGYLRRPGHFFGTLGLLAFSTGFLIGTYITYLRLTSGNIQNRHPLLFLGILLMVIGIQLLSTGLLAEIIIYSKQKVDYSSHIKEVLS